MSLSPNHGERRGGARPDLVVIHYTAMESAALSLARLCDPAAQVSAHWLIDTDGTVTALVPEERRAWHAGSGRWGEVTDVNSRSIGIELQNRGDHPFAAAQMTALERLLEGILDRWAIPPERVIGHSDMAPARKADPGPRFDWRRLARAGLSVWPEEGAKADPAQFLPALHAFGYDPAQPPAVLLRAFRLRFRPWGEGAPDPLDAGMACDLARRFPVDPARPGP
ncbi:N-acetylmuramoyl-L-alanine amidase [Rubellimicrobium thermophilum]|uniref:N-acetylmuramoyl-L-alanine amidase n=1 Tax=Rubellimicrobium thermophilum TaxID=295419 RepID=UPI0011840267|nr:N-acetylmuramoyl-L-alanine amidase [Rubellimicrobium thermophilum]